MSQLRRNLVANYLGQGWTAVMGLAFIPVYIRYLGMEAYGLIGLFAVMQAWLTLLDMGMTPTLNREMARFSAGAHTAQSIRDLLRSLEIICFSIAALIALGTWAASDYLANDWLKTQQLSPSVVAQAVAVMAFVAALRFVEGIYRGSLFGLQRQVWYNGANASFATLRYVGVVGVLEWVSPTPQAFFLWQGFISLVSVWVFAVHVHRSLPQVTQSVRFSRTAVAAVWKFASGMMGITLLSLLLTQVDKVILSRMLTLTAFGYYALAATVAGVLIMLIGPVTQALFPRMVELVTDGDQAALGHVYHRGAGLVTVLTAPVVMLLVFYGRGVLYMWSGDAILATKTAPILSALALGTFLNALMWVPYTCQLAHGWTSLTLKVNAVAVGLFIPAIFLVVPIYGALGSAWIWVALNTGYVLIVIQLMHRRLLTTEKWRWYLFDVGRPALGCFAVMLGVYRWRPDQYSDRLVWFWFLLASGIAALLVAILSSDQKVLTELRLGKALVDRALKRG